MKTKDMKTKDMLLLGGGGLALVGMGYVGFKGLKSIFGGNGSASGDGVEVLIDKEATRHLKEVSTVVNDTELTIINARGQESDPEVRAALDVFLDELREYESAGRVYVDSDKSAFDYDVYVDEYRDVLDAAGVVADLSGGRYVFEVASDG